MRASAMLESAARVVALGFCLAGCAAPAPAPSQPRYNIIRPQEHAAKMGGIAPDKQAEIQLMLQQHETSTLKCYQDVMNEKLDRKFQGTVRVTITVEPGGHASDVKFAGGTLNEQAVQECLTKTIKGFEFPAVPYVGDVQYEYRFRPAY